MNGLTQIVLALCLFGAVLAEQKSYKGYQVFETEPLSFENALLLRNLQAASGDYDFWRDAHTNRKAQIMASPDNRDALLDLLKKHGIGYSVKVEDVQQAIVMSQVENKMARQNDFFEHYQSHDSMIAFIDNLASTYSSFASTRSIGTTAEGRDMRVLELNMGGTDKPIFWLEAGIHAREWIAPAVGLWVINEIVTNHDAHPQFLENLNINFIPSANPDGYEYSRSNERLWRKNREINDGAVCVGTDLNRNFGYHFAESGVSSNPCSDVFCGEEAFSTTEASALRDYFNSMSPMPQLSVCLHSAAELFLYPYGYALNTFPPEIDDIRNLCEPAVDALNAVHGQSFQCLNAADLYPAAGAADDWYESQGCKYTYTPELRDNGFGFLLPESLIIPSGEEMYAAIEVMLGQMITEFA